MMTREEADLRNLRWIGDPTTARKSLLAAHLGLFHVEMLEGIPTTAFSVIHLRHLVAKAHPAKEVAR